MNQDKTTNFSNLDIILFILPAILLPNFAELLNVNIPAVALSAILGGIGGVIGAFLFWVLKDKPKRTKWIAIGLVSIISILFMFFLGGGFNRTDASLITCEICGYNTLEQKGDECDICLVEITAEYQKLEEYASIKEMIKEEQLLFFAIEDEFSLFIPTIYDDDEYKYVKDENWKPVITQMEIDAVKKELEVKRNEITPEIIQ